jgi:hypothetical protein
MPLQSIYLSTAGKIEVLNFLPHFFFGPWPPFPKGPAACCIGSLLLLGRVCAGLEIYSPWGFSQKSQNLIATFQNSRRSETPKYCIKPGVKSRPQELLGLENIAFFQKKICSKITSQSES